MSGIYDKLIFDMSTEGNEGISLPEADVPQPDIRTIFPEDCLRARPPNMPSVSEPEVMRHFISLSLKNHHVDRGIYPLGSCTMKYNPKINEDLARLPQFLHAHPFYPDELVQGTLVLLYQLS